MFQKALGPWNVWEIALQIAGKALILVLKYWYGQWKKTHELPESNDPWSCLQNATDDYIITTSKKNLSAQHDRHAKQSQKIIYAAHVAVDLQVLDTEWKSTMALHKRDNGTPRKNPSNVDKNSRG